MCYAVVIFVVFVLYIFSRLVWGVNVGAFLCDGPFFYGGDGLFFPNRIVRLGCRFGMRRVRSIGDRRGRYMWRCVWFEAISIDCVVYYFIPGFVLEVFSCFYKFNWCVCSYCR